MKLVWTEPAVSDLQAIHAYISRDSEIYATHFAENVLVQAERLAQFPRMGRVVPEADDENIRELILGNYRLMYRVQAARVEILAIVHGRRELGLLARKPWEVE